MHKFESAPLTRFNRVGIDVPASFDVQLDHGVKLDYENLISNTPCVTSTYDGSLTNPQLVLSTDYGLEPWDERLYYPVSRLSSIHGRTLEVIADTAEIYDQYGNAFYSINIKGCDLHKPHFMRSATAARDHIIHGLQESIVIERIIRSSQHLRKFGVGTEYICGLVAPTSYPFDSTQGIDEKKLLALPQFLEQLSDDFAKKSKDNGRSALEIKTEMIDRFKDCSYLITYRAHDCPYRLNEIADPKKFISLKEFLYRNTPSKQMHAHLEKKSPTSFLFFDFVPEFATNLAKMHESGIVHGFLHENNITALGSIVDLDSCKGEPLGIGDAPTTDYDEFKDVIYAIASIQEVVDRFDFQEKSSVLEQRNKDIAKHFAIKDLLAIYINERCESEEQALVLLANLIKNWQRAMADNNHETNGLSALRFTEYALSTYRFLQEHFSEEMKYDDSFDIRLTKTLDETILSAFPYNFLRDYKGKIFDQKWTYGMAAENRMVLEKDREAQPMLKGLVKNVILLNKMNEKVEISNKQSAIKFLEELHIIKSLVGDDSDDAEKLSAESANQARLKIDQLYDNLILRNISVNKEQEGLKGLIEISVDNRLKAIKCPVIYCENPTDQKNAVKSYEATQRAQVSLIPRLKGSEFREVVRAIMEKGDDNYIIAPYSILEDLTSYTDPGDILPMLFAITAQDQKAIYIVSGKNTDDPRIYVFDFSLFQVAQSPVYDLSSFLDYERLKDELISSVLL